MLTRYNDFIEKIKKAKEDFKNQLSDDFGQEFSKHLTEIEPPEELLVSISHWDRITDNDIVRVFKFNENFGLRFIIYEDKLTDAKNYVKIDYIYRRVKKWGTTSSSKYYDNETIEEFVNDCISDINKIIMNKQKKDEKREIRKTETMKRIEERDKLFKDISQEFSKYLIKDNSGLAKNSDDRNVFKLKDNDQYSLAVENWGDNVRVSYYFRKRPRGYTRSSIEIYGINKQAYHPVNQSIDIFVKKCIENLENFIERKKIEKENREFKKNMKKFNV